MSRPPEEIVSKLFVTYGLLIVDVDVSYWTKIKRAWYRRAPRFGCFKVMSSADLAHMPLAFISFAYKATCENKDGTWRHWEYHPKKDKLRWNSFYCRPGIYDPAHKTYPDVLEIPLVENERALAMELLRAVI